MKQIKFIIPLIASVVFCNCSTNNKVDNEKQSISTRLNSDDYDTREKRVALLKKQITPYSDFRDAEFELFNANGNFNNERIVIPGASSLDYKFVVLVDQSSIHRWTAGMQRVKGGIEPRSFDWVNNLNNKLKSKIKEGDLGVYYERSGESNYAVVFKNSGLIFRRIITD